MRTASGTPPAEVIENRVGIVETASGSEGAVKVKVRIEARFDDEHAQGVNTIAEIPRSDPKLKDEVVIVGGHLDSWSAGTGATDNGAGVVVAMGSHTRFQ